jgi:hypothetical protein
MNENNNTSLPATTNLVLIADSPFPPDLATRNTAILQISTNNNPSPETVAAGTSTMSSFLMARVHLPPLVSTICHRVFFKKASLCSSQSCFGWLWCRDGSQKSKVRKQQKTRAEEIKEKRYNELKNKLHEQTKTQKHLVCLFELCTLIKTAMMTKNKKLLKEANDEMAKFLGSPTNNNDANATDDDNNDDNDDDFPLMIPCAGV